MSKTIQLGRLLALALLTLTTAPASAYDEIPYDWPWLYEPTRVLTLNLFFENADDWETIKRDTTYDIELPALLWADGDVKDGDEEEQKVLVSVRRKSADSIGGKVSLKIDINEYEDLDTRAVSSWNGVKKLSLENGDDVDVVAEGFAWYLNRVAVDLTPSYKPGLAAWVQLYVNGEYIGVYVNVEQRDKTFLKNRGLYAKGETWLYKAGSIGANYELKVGDPDSPTSAELCYSPFGAEGGGGKGNGKGKGNKGDGGGGTGCEAPEGDAAMAADLGDLIDMDAMLTQGAVSAFTMGPDALFSKGKNFYFIDFSVDKRLYVPWDLDSVFVSKNPEGSIYGSSKKKGRNTTLSQSPYEELILNNKTFCDRYDVIMADLLTGPTGPMRIDAQITFLNDLETLLASPLGLDPNNNIDGSISERFDSLRQWVTARDIDIKAQLGNNYCGGLDAL